jgi:hypothetical protein
MSLTKVNVITFLNATMYSTNIKKRKKIKNQQQCKNPTVVKMSNENFQQQ